MVRTARALEARGLTHGTSGNVSLRWRGRILITPTRTAADRLRRRDVVRASLGGVPARSRHRPSSELGLHAAVYRDRWEVGAIVHTHSPYATAWSCGGHPLEPVLAEAAYYGTTRLGLVSAAPAGSERLRRAVLHALQMSRAVLLERHGVFAVGQDLAEALAVATSVEHQARVAWLCRFDEDLRSQLA